jgi:ribosomal protein S18 acetylase RimI-like enzyme
MPTYQPAKDEEYEECFELMHDAADYLESTLELMEMSSDEFSKLFRKVGQVYTVREGDELAGFYWIEQRENLLHLHGLILAEPFRGKGFGTQILRTLEDQYRDSVDAIELGVHESNARAIKLYERLGFETVKNLDDLGFLIMQKRLQYRRTRSESDPLSGSQ